jgi:superfamily II DNA/RNA helicase
MEHYILVINPGHKDHIIARIKARNGKTLLFLKTQRGTDRLCDKLAHAGVPIGALHGDKSQAVRTCTLALFKGAVIAAFATTDVAARCIHTGGISLAVQVDVQQDHKDFLDRSVRTAHAGESDVIATLPILKQQKSVSGITSHAGVTHKSASVTSLSTGLMRITGAQEPSRISFVAPIVENKPLNRGTRKAHPNSAQRRPKPRQSSALILPSTKVKTWITTPLPYLRSKLSRGYSHFDFIQNPRGPHKIYDTLNSKFLV